MPPPVFVAHSGAYVFTVDGVPVNADGTDGDGQPLWMIEELSMSVMLLASMASLVDGSYEGAGCCCDYVELGIKPLPQGLAEIYSGYSGEPSSIRTAQCRIDDLFRAFNKATLTWKAYYHRLYEHISHKLIDRPHTYDMNILSRQMDPKFWLPAFAHWHEAYVAYLKR